MARVLSPARLGALLCVVAGVAFSVQPVLVELARDVGAASGTVLAWRYVLAATVLLGVAGRRVLAVPRGTALLVFVLGLVVYAADSALYFAAIARTSTSLATLLHYGYIAVVVLTAALLGRERLTPKRVVALAAVLLGVALVGGTAGRLDVIGIGYALAAAGAYAVYVLLSDRLLAVADPSAIAGLLMAGAGVAFVTITMIDGSTGDVGGVGGALLILATAVTGTTAVVSFLGGIRRVGPATASLLVTIEVPVTLVLAAVVLGDRLSGGQVLGAAVVLGAVLLVQARRRPRARLRLRAE